MKQLIRHALPLAAIVLAGFAVSAFQLPCWAFCTEQTGLQQGYTAARDSCREYASLKVDDGAAQEDKERKGELLAQFAGCMADKGWTVPGAKDASATKIATAPPPAPVPVQALQELAPAAGGMAAPRQKEILSRSAECAYARHAAAYTSESASRAQACDLECAQGSKAGKKAAACGE